MGLSMAALRTMPLAIALPLNSMSVVGIGCLFRGNRGLIDGDGVQQAGSNSADFSFAIHL